MQDLSSGDELLSAVVRLVEALRGIDTSDGLTMGARSALRRLARSGPVRVTDLARGQQVTQPAMTQLMRRLEDAGLVQRLPDADDGRVTLIKITNKGRRLAARGQAEHAAALDACLAALDQTDRVAIANAVPALGRMADAFASAPRQ